MKKITLIITILLLAGLVLVGGGCGNNGDNGDEDSEVPYGDRVVRALKKVAEEFDISWDNYAKLEDDFTVRWILTVPRGCGGSDCVTNVNFIFFKKGLSSSRSCEYWVNIGNYQACCFLSTLGNENSTKVYGDDYTIYAQKRGSASCTSKEMMEVFLKEFESE